LYPVFYRISVFWLTFRICPLPLHSPRPIPAKHCCGFLLAVSALGGTYRPNIIAGQIPPKPPHVRTQATNERVSDCLAEKYTAGIEGGRTRAPLSIDTPPQGRRPCYCHFRRQLCPHPRARVMADGGDSVFPKSHFFWDRRPHARKAAVCSQLLLHVSERDSVQRRQVALTGQAD
jgi:hypothetical protein